MEVKENNKKVGAYVVFTFSTKRENRHFPVVVVLRWQKGALATT